MSRGRRTLRIAYPGEPGSFAEEAALAATPGALPVPLPGFADVFAAVRAGRAPADGSDEAPLAAGVLPIENVLGGTVRETYDLLLGQRGAHRGRGRGAGHALCLAALPGERLEDVSASTRTSRRSPRRAASWAPRPWTLLTTYNTAAAGRLLLEAGERAAAAVSHPVPRRASAWPCWP